MGINSENDDNRNWATVAIGTKKIGLGQPTFFIAEVASAHEGNLEVAKKMIEVAVGAQADAVKFQLFKKEAYMVPAHHIYPLAERIEFTVEQWKELRDYARGQGIIFIADAFDLPSVELAAELDVEALKIHSSDLTNPELIERVARAGKPVFLGVGATTMEEITAAVNVIRKYHNNIVIMHGYQAFPTKLSEIHFKRVKTLRTTYHLPIGILDHTEGETFMSKIIPLLTPFVGAHVIEKHFTLDRSQKGIDYESSVNPETLKSIVENLRLIETTLGTEISPPQFSPDEQGYRDLMKKTIVAEKEISLGTIITPNLISYKRAGPGLRPVDAHLLLGKKAKAHIQQHQTITVDHVS